MIHRKQLAYVALGVFLVSGVIIQSIGALPNDVDRQNNTWEQTLHRGLVLYFEGEHTDVFQLLEGRTRTLEPSTAVHQALALMAKAFQRCYSPEQENQEWKVIAKQYLRDLSGKSEPTDTDMVILALLSNDGYVTTDVSFLDKLLSEFPDSPWRDWAFWEKARVLGLNSFVSRDPLGLHALKGNEDRVGCLVTENPQLWVQGRAAESFLKSHPNTYMGETMQEDLARWRLTSTIEALLRLKANSGDTASVSGCGFPLTQQQIEAIAKAEVAIRSVEDLFSEEIKRRATANGYLGDFLWWGESEWKIIDYFGELIMIPENQRPILDKDIMDWVKPLLEQRREQKSEWQRLDTQ